MSILTCDSVKGLIKLEAMVAMTSMVSDFVQLHLKVSSSCGNY
jgi:hypothetical protein